MTMRAFLGMNVRRNGEEDRNCLHQKGNRLAAIDFFDLPLCDKTLLHGNTMLLFEV
jgi:hypothetical protein